VRFEDYIVYLSDETKRNYLWILDNFKRYVQKADDDDYLIGYFSHLKKKGCSSSMLNLARAALKAYYLCYDLEWPKKLERWFKVKERSDEIKRPVLELDDVVAMIEAALSKGNWVDKVFLCLSTIYGLRFSEMKNLRPDHIRIPELRLTIYTRKGGEKRIHIIPTEIVRILEDFRVPPVSEIAAAFNRLAMVAGVYKKLQEMRKEFQGVGWHAIRRALIT